MKKQSKPKLVVRKQVVRALDPRSLTVAVGGTGAALLSGDPACDPFE